ncbi:MAG: tyrosine-type recombinase/integrase, partial [Pannonibacter indicus]
MAARTLTDVEVKSLRAEAGKRATVYDAKARGLCLRISGETRSWSFVYRPKGATKQRRYTIGDYPAWSLRDAREKAWRLRQRVQDGGDPVLEEKTRRDSLTVEGMIDRFMTNYARAKLRSADEYLQLLQKDVIPRMGERRAQDITRPEVGVLLDDVAKRAPTVANRVMNVLSSVFSWAVSEGLVGDNPVRGLKKRTVEVPKERFLADAEIKALWQATDRAGAGYRDAIRLILLTGQRPGECAGICREEVDLAKAIWTLPPERTKNKRAHSVPLVGEALAIVERLAGAVRRGPMIQTPRGKVPSSQDLAKAFERLRAVLDQPATAHDLRR